MEHPKTGLEKRGGKGKYKKFFNRQHNADETAVFLRKQVEHSR